MACKGGIDLQKSLSEKDYKTGRLPEVAPLAAAYVPMQSAASPSYDSAEALARGTLFPGLDLPFMNIVNNELPRTPLTELQAICFVAHELELYLETHRDDTEAFEMFQTFLALREEAKERYTKMCGPVTTTDLLGMDSFTWQNDPWPWDYKTAGEG